MKPETSAETRREFNPPSVTKRGMVEFHVSAHTRLSTTLGPAMFTEVHDG